MLCLETRGGWTRAHAPLNKNVAKQRVLYCGIMAEAEPDMNKLSSISPDFDVGDLPDFEEPEEAARDTAKSKSKGKAKGKAKAKRKNTAKSSKIHDRVKQFEELSSRAQQTSPRTRSKGKHKAKPMSPHSLQTSRTSIADYKADKEEKVDIAEPAAPLAEADEIDQADAEVEAAAPALSVKTAPVMPAALT